MKAKEAVQAKKRKTVEDGERAWLVRHRWHRQRTTSQV